MFERSEDKMGVVRIIRCKNTFRYFGERGWTEDENGAKTFSDNLGAVRTCVEHGLNNVELVLRVPGSTHDLFCTTIR